MDFLQLMQQSNERCSIYPSYLSKVKRIPKSAHFVSSSWSPAWTHTQGQQSRKATNRHRIYTVREARSEPPPSIHDFFVFEADSGIPGRRRRSFSRAKFEKKCCRIAAVLLRASKNRSSFHPSNRILHLKKSHDGFYSITWIGKALNWVFIPLPRYDMKAKNVFFE